MSEFTLDASILLAILGREAGWESAADLATPGCLISTVNLSEVVAKLRERGVSETDVKRGIRSFDMEIMEFTQTLAWDAGFLRTLTMSKGLSLGDRACLALARQMQMPALTKDRSWEGLDVGIEIHVVR